MSQQCPRNLPIYPNLVSFLSMDTLSSSVSTFNFPRSHPKSNQLHLLNNHLIPPHQSHLIPPTTNPKTSNKTTTHFTTRNNFISHVVSSSQSAPLHLKQPSKPSDFNQKASTGYAVALLDAARHYNVLETVKRDVKRLSRWVCNEQLRGVITNPCLEMNGKGEILKEIMKKGKLNKQLVKLVKLLIEKSKVEMVSEVLMEFGRIYDQLSGNVNTQLVLVPSGVKMDENQLMGISKRIQKISGAEKVTVRQLVDDRLP